MSRVERAAERLWYVLEKVRRRAPDAKFPHTGELLLMVGCRQKELRAAKHLLIDSGLLRVNADYSVWSLHGTRFPWDVQ